jgi:hypothetical protein
MLVYQTFVSFQIPLLGYNGKLNEKMRKMTKDILVISHISVRI